MTRSITTVFDGEVFRLREPVDCGSFVVLQERGIIEAPAAGRDVAEAGFFALRRAP
jgi:hypothetical protein